MHEYKINDEVYYPCDKAPFKVVGIREHVIEIEGDWSGGTPNVSQAGWVHVGDVKPFDWSKAEVYNRKIEIDLYTKESHLTHRHPENSYEYKTKEEAIKCIRDLINNDIAGIYRAEITIK